MRAFRFGGNEPCFLVVRRRRTRARHLYDVVLHWVAEHYPQLAPLFRIKSLPCILPPRPNVVLHIPWLQDPVQEWSRWRYRQANQLAAQCDTRNIPIINRVDRLINATKSIGARILSEAGILTPRMARIDDAAAFRETLLGLRPPLFVREDWGHRGQIIRADTHEEARRIPVESFRRPVAIEIVDVRDTRDGLFHKFRYVAAGELGVTHHVQVTTDWVTRGDIRVFTDATREEELAYIDQQDPNHATLQHARKALGLDFVAFDYGYDREGRMIIWEANPYPYIHFSAPGGRLTYRNHAMDRTIAALVRLYLHSGGIPIPDSLERRATY